MKTRKMSLEQFKEKSAFSSIESSLDKIQGGGWSDCHGALGQLGKACTKEKIIKFFNGFDPHKVF